MGRPAAPPEQCGECGELLAPELVAIGAGLHILCGDDAYRADLAYCLWGRVDGAFTMYGPGVRLDADGRDRWEHGE